MTTALRPIPRHLGVPGPLTLPPREDGSCDVHDDHGAAQPLMLQAHHVFPEFLQKAVYGRTVEQDRAAVCGTAHDTVHVLLREMLKNPDAVPLNARVPKRHAAFAGEYRLAYRGYRRYVAARDGR